MQKILFVCTGNTCRSPLAESLLKAKLPELEVQSAGLFASHGAPAAQGSIEVLKKKGITLNHKSQPVSESLLNWADLVLSMTTQHKQSLALQFPGHQDRIYTLKEYVLKDSEEDNWQELKEAYSEFEEKRAGFMKEKGKELNSIELDNALHENFRNEITKINQLESSQPDLDISDPFGGNVETYQATMEEIEKYVDLLARKIK